MKINYETQVLYEELVYKESGLRFTFNIHFQERSQMNHSTQEPKSLQLAVELDYRREYEAAHELRTMQARIAELEAAAHHADYKMEGWLCKQYPLEACLYPESKDWVEGDYRDRVEWLHTMYESVKSEVEQLKAKLHTIGTGDVEQSVQPQVQADTTAPAQLPAAHQEPVAWRAHTFDCGIGSKGSFALTMRLEQVEMWKRKGLRVEPLYTAPQLT